MIIIKTKFGNAKINRGYYRITSRSEGNRHKLLHRLIFEDFYGYIPKNYHVHHKDGNKLNNCIMNLQLLHKSEHIKHHNCGKSLSIETKLKISEANKGKVLSDETKLKISEAQKGNKHHMFGKHHSIETRKKISEACKGDKHYMFGKHHSDETKLKISKSKNTTGYYHVLKKRNNKYKQGFYYQYHYYENDKHKRISSISIDKLEDKVKNKGLEWRKL